MSEEAILNELNSITPNTLMETLGIVFTEVGDDYLVATMPVNDRVHQPMGLLHGGATVALAESVASAASMLFIDTSSQEVRGIEITANHVRSVRSGTVTATAKAVHNGKMTQLWEIRVVDELGKLISVCKMTSIALSKA